MKVRISFPGAVLGTLALLASGCAGLHASAAAPTHRDRPVLLAVLPEIGVVYWRDNCAGRDAPGQSLGVQIYENGQSGSARFRARSLVIRRSLQPGYPTTWFPCRNDDVQRLAVAAGGENGAVVGAVRAKFGYSGGQPHYSPPRVSVQLYPRRYYYSRDFLGKFTG